MVAARGDHIVLRRETTLGGGRILDPQPPRRADENRLRLLEQGDARTLLVGLFETPLQLEALRRRALLSDDQLRAGLSALEQSDGWVFTATWLSEKRASAVANLTLRDAEIDPGLTATELLDQAPWSGAVAPLLGLDASDGKFYLPGRRPNVGTRGDDLEQRLISSGLDPIRVDDNQLARQLEHDGRLVRLGDGLGIDPRAYEHAKAVLVEECEREGSISLPRYRDALGVSRRVAQLLLERFDTDRVTIRTGDVRRLRRSAMRR